MKRRVLLLCILLLSGMLGAAEPPKTSTDYVRFVDGDEGDSLETAVVRFESPQKTIVDLVGAIHIADKSYYDALNVRFRGYDAVLYELVGPPMHERKKEQMKPGGGSGSLQWVGTMQTFMRDTLKLHGQLEGIDYAAPNLVHADMSSTQFHDTREKKQESFLKLYLKLWQAQQAATAKEDEDSAANSDAAALATLFRIMMSKNGSLELKRGMASQFDQVEKLMSGVEEGEGTVIIGERNRVAFEVLDKQLAAGKKRLAIFYGAAHLPDMEQRLLKRGFKRSTTEWLKAWWMPYE